ncbi:Fic family protein [Alkalibaculum bacchi]|uniref:Fic/DOC family protein n=1 Tax=Alkalibaculum bacchi TaxID=645887 RepID=UPI0026E945E0|nr:Fic family protein [Alkalibaculum bacchi]
MSHYYEYEWDNKYCYPNSYVLRNKLNIKDEDHLEEVERQITAIKILDLKMKVVKGNMDVKHLKDIHKHIFRDLYDWAGETRTVDISKGTQFCNYMFVDKLLQELFENLKHENYLIGVSIDSVIKRLSYYLGELNAIHPFREGNGRTQRVFVEYLAQIAGYYVDFSDITEQEMIDASLDSFMKDYVKMENIFKKITSPTSKEEQKKFINEIVTTNSAIKKVYKANTNTKT